MLIKGIEARPHATATLRDGAAPRLVSNRGRDANDLVAGNWRFVVLSGGVVLLDKTFIIKTSCNKLISKDILPHRCWSIQFQIGTCQPFLVSLFANALQIVPDQMDFSKISPTRTAGGRT